MGDYIDHRRDDFRISYGSHLSIPIHIKKNSHVDLWRGMTDHLVLNDTRNPKSEGYGVYVVFWFGAGSQYMRVVSPDRDIPKKPAELNELLEKQLDPELRKRIHILVLDVSEFGR